MTSVSPLRNRAGYGDTARLHQEGRKRGREEGRKEGKKGVREGRKGREGKGTNEIKNKQKEIKLSRLE
jgi:predicted transposase YdaD